MRSLPVAPAPSAAAPSPAPRRVAAGCGGCAKQESVARAHHGRSRSEGARVSHAEQLAAGCADRAPTAAVASNRSTTGRGPTTPPDLQHLERSWSQPTSPGTGKRPPRHRGRSSGNSAMASSRCVAITVCAPPSRSSVSRRSTGDPTAASSSHSRFNTSWRYVVSMPVVVPRRSCPDGAESVSPVSTSPRRTWSRTASASPGPRSTGGSPGRSWLKRSMGSVIACLAASRSR